MLKAAYGDDPTGLQSRLGAIAQAFNRGNPDLLQLKPKTTTFDLFNLISQEAINAKTLNTLSVGYIKRPQSIYRDVKGYVDEVPDYSPLSYPISIRRT